MTIWFVLTRTSVGLSLRPAGEIAGTADAAGISVGKIRLVAVAIGVAFAGAYLTLSLAPGWSVKPKTRQRSASA